MNAPDFHLYFCLELHMKFRQTMICIFPCKDNALLLSLRFSISGSSMQLSFQSCFLTVLYQVCVTSLPDDIFIFAETGVYISINSDGLKINNQLSNF